MRRTRRELSPPAGHQGLERVRSGSEGVWWERGDGLRVQLAAPEREARIERTRLSLLGMLLAYVASSSNPQR